MGGIRVAFAILVAGCAMIVFAPTPALVLFAAPAFAQPPNYTPIDRQMEAKTVVKHTGLPIPVPIDPLGLNGKTTTTTTNPDGTTTTTSTPNGSVFDALFNKISDLLTSDFASAIDLSTKSVPPDVNGGACWTALQPVASIVKSHPTPLTGKLATDIQNIRNLIITMQGACATPACGTVFAEMAAANQRLIQQLPIHAIIPGSVINPWEEVCANLPKVSTTLTTVLAPITEPTPVVVKPTPAPTPKPTVTPTPSPSPTASPTPTPSPTSTP
jgi:hypothetical protein